MSRGYASLFLTIRRRSTARAWRRSNAAVTNAAAGVVKVIVFSSGLYYRLLIDRQWTLRVAASWEQTMWPRPLKLLREATRAVPAVRYALGLAGIMAALALGTALLRTPRAAVMGSLVMLALMVLLLVFAKAAAMSAGLVRGPALVMTWGIVTLFILASTLTVTSVFFDRPKPFSDLVAELDGSSTPAPLLPRAATAASSPGVASDGKPQLIPEVAPLERLRLAIELQHAAICRPSGTTIDARAFTGTNLSAMLRPAADWIEKTLTAKFVTKGRDEIAVDAKLRITAEGNYTIKITPEDDDPLVKPYFWLFSADSIKQSHTALSDAGEATSEAIERLMKTGNADRSKILLHVSRPGYDLQLIRLGVNQQVESVSLKRAASGITLVVNDQRVPSLSELATELRVLGFRVLGGADYRKLTEQYDKALGPGLADGDRLALLRECRVDAFADGHVSTESK